ncbi:MAG TPA: papain-like cysteine protease family protein [Terriglobales bacterium]|nr:papain-like cysteine protease family protein [Terriglobales bacterium]
MDFTKVVQAITIQQCPEWCWAASIAMIFTFSGHPIDQKQIVQQTYGNIVCLPAQNNATIASALSRRYVDANGKPFTSRITAAFDAQAGFVGINNGIIVNALQSNQPLLICNTHHAMVVCAADFAPTPFGPNIYALGVVDPWPYSSRFHPLSQAEIVPMGIPLGMGQQGQMMFVATVSVT